MKSLEFGEDQLQDLSKIGKDLFNDEHDPRSSAYIRKLNRPAIDWFKISVFTFLPIILITAVIAVLKHFGVSAVICIIAACTVLIGYIVINLKRAVICLIKIYQRYAPDSIRNKCRFEPSCSEYMILAIKKYGLIKGLGKGLQRLKRCNINGGGFDFP